MSGLTQDLDADGLRDIGEQVHALYSRGPFGRVLKTEIDGIFFRAYARHQHRLKRRTEEFRWHHLGPQDVRELSNQNEEDKQHETSECNFLLLTKPGHYR